MWQVNVFTIFPEAFPGNLGISVVGKAFERRIWNLNLIDLRKFPVKADRIDSIPYGGGVGMILSPITFEKAFSTLSETERRWKIFYLSPRGKQLKQSDLHELSKLSGITMLCGRYEGVDQRIIDFYSMEEISIGDFILLGGEVAAMAIIEGCVRLLPGVVGNCASVNCDSFENSLLEYDQYTRPSIFKGLSVPEILLSGNHKKINEFRLEQSKNITIKQRSDLWAQYVEEKIK